MATVKAEVLKIEEGHEIGTTEAKAKVEVMSSFSSSSSLNPKPKDKDHADDDPKQCDLCESINPTKKDNESPEEGHIPYSWMVKPCYVYKLENKDCRSIAARFNQYFVDGKLWDCSQWKIDHQNCLAWEKKKDQKALEALIESEKDRVRRRLKAHYDNDVWENRLPHEIPPSNWNCPLPEGIQEKFKGSYLQLKADMIKRGEMDEGQRAFQDDNSKLHSSCTIL